MTSQAQSVAPVSCPGYLNEKLANVEQQQRFNSDLSDSSDEMGVMAAKKNAMKPTPELTKTDTKPGMNKEIAANSTYLSNQDNRKTTLSTVRVKLASASPAWDNKAEVEVDCDNPDKVVQNMLRSIVGKFPPTSSVSVERGHIAQNQPPPFNAATPRIYNRYGNIPVQHLSSGFPTLATNQQPAHMFPITNQQFPIPPTHQQFPTPPTPQQFAQPPTHHQFPPQFFSQQQIPQGGSPRPNTRSVTPIHGIARQSSKANSNKDAPTQTNQDSITQNPMILDDNRNRFCIDRKFTDCSQPTALIHEVPKFVSKVELREVVKEVAKYEVEWVDKVVEVPQIHYVDKYEEVVEHIDVVKNVPKIEIVDIVREIPKYVPKIETKYVDNFVPVQGEKVNVVRAEEVNTSCIVPKFVDRNVPVVMSQCIFPEIEETNEVLEVEVNKYVPYIVPVDVYVPLPINLPLKIKADGEVREEVVSENCDPNLLQHLMVEMNPHLQQLELFNFQQHELFESLVAQSNQQAAQNNVEAPAPIVNPVQAYDSIINSINETNNASATSPASNTAVRPAIKISQPAIDGNRKLSGASKLSGVSKGRPSQPPSRRVTRNATGGSLQQGGMMPPTSMFIPNGPPGTLMPGMSVPISSIPYSTPGMMPVGVPNNMYVTSAPPPPQCLMPANPQMRRPTLTAGGSSTVGGQ